MRTTATRRCSRTRACTGRRGAPAGHHGHLDPDQGRPDHHDRRPIRRDEGGAQGFYIIRADDLDEALGYGAQCSGARFGATIEVRPVMDVAYPQESAQTSVGATAAEPRHRRHPRYRRPPVPRGAGTGGRDAHPRPRRLRPRRGGGPGRVHRRTRGLARPRHPGTGCWITTTARNRAIDRIRRRRRLRDKTDELARDAAIEADLAAIEPGTGSDDATCRSPTIDCA